MKSNYRYIFNLLTCVVMLVMFNGCGSSSAGSGNAVVPGPVFAQSPITISSIGTVPVFSEAGSTTVFYVHNNTNDTIKDIVYSVEKSNSNNVFSKLKSMVLSKLGINPNTKDVTLDDASTLSCSEIYPNSFCAITFSTPKGNLDNGSNDIKAMYSYKKKNYVFNTLLNYAYVDSPQTPGIHTLGASNMNWNYKDNSFTTVYFYAGGSGVYDNLNGITSNPAYIINAATIANGQQIYSNSQIAAYDITAPMIPNQTLNKNLINGIISGNLSVTASQGGSIYNANANLVQNSTIQPIMIAGLVSPLDTSYNSQSTTTSLNLVNSGASNAIISSVSVPAGLVIKNDSPSGCSNASAIITPNSACMITLTNTVAGSSGSADVVVSYSNSSSTFQSTVTAPVIWYNSGTTPIISANIIPNNPTFNATTPESVILAISNPTSSGFAVAISKISRSSSSSVSANLTSLTLQNCSNGSSESSLVPGGSCSYNVVFTDATTITNGILQLEIDYLFGSGSNASRMININYNTTGYVTNFQFTPTPIPLLTVIGDNSSSVIQVESLVNLGTAPGILTSLSLTNTTIPPSSLAIVNNNCTNGMTLQKNQSCSFSIKLGPIASDTQINGVESVIAIYTSQGQGGSTGVAVSESANYVVNPNTQSLILESVIPAGQASGSGSSGSSFVFMGNSSNSQTITLNYRNNGTNSVSIQGIQSYVNTSYWSLSNDSCTGKILAAGAGICSLTYSNVMPTYSKYMTFAASSIDTTFSVPTIIIKDQNVGDIFAITPNAPVGNKIYVTESLIYVVNSLTNESNNIIKYYQSYTNGAGYQAFTLTGNMDDYFSNSSAPVATFTGGMTCSSSPSNGIVTIVCNVNGSSSSGSVNYNYTVIPSYSKAQLGANWLTNTNQAISLAPRYTAIQVN